MLPVSAGKDLAGWFLGSMCTNTDKRQTLPVAGRSDLTHSVCKVWTWKRFPWSKWMSFKVWLLVFWVEWETEFKGWYPVPLWHRQGKVIPTGSWWQFLLLHGWSGKSFRRAAAACMLLWVVPDCYQLFPLWDHHMPVHPLPTFFGTGEFHQAFAAPGHLSMAAYATCTSSWCCFRLIYAAVLGALLQLQ